MTEDEFNSLIDDWIQQPKEKWNHITCLAYFCHKYKAKYDVDFKLVRAKNGPTMGKEARDFSKLYKELLPDTYMKMKPHEKKEEKHKVSIKIYNFINWLFDYKFRQSNVNGTHLFNSPAIRNEFERMYQAHLKKKSKTATFDDLIKWCKSNLSEILDLHQLEEPSDLDMIIRYSNAYPDSLPERELIKKAKELKLVS